MVNVIPDMVLGLSQESPVVMPDELHCKKIKFSKVFGISFPKFSLELLSDEEKVKREVMYMQYPFVDID